ncbi:MAG TPA: NAD(P)/FAD-dependent oxidoreductase [Verrucomicrobiae bacterium]|nr:NAD(P)/FAD-dependent oxidoreductase [Verrucomicrobiae bacterium]
MKHGPAVIIGGGISGLSAALELARNDVPTTVLEAKDRFGGRIHTIHHDGVLIELGAEFVHGRSKLLLKAIEEAKLSTQAVPATNRVLENGELQDSNMWEIVADVLKRVNIRSPDCSIDAFLAEQPLDDHTRNLVRNFISGFDAANPGRISAHARLRAEYSGEQMAMDQQMRVTEGYGALVEYFLREIQTHGGRVISGANVRHVRWKRGKVEVLAELQARHQVFRGQVAIITLPVSVLRSSHVAFEPSLPDKNEAATGLEFGNVVKVIFQFRKSAWDDFGFIQAPGAPIPTWWSDARGPTLIGWAGGLYADALLECSDDDLCTMGLETLSKMLFNGAPISGLRQQLVAAHYFNWAQDPEVRGAYSYIPVNGMDLPKLLAAPVAGTLFFAGEATVTDAQTGTVFGALETGRRAAREILAISDG